MNIFKTVLWLTVLATYMLGCNGDGNFKFEKVIAETDEDSTLIPDTIILSHENDDIKTFGLERPLGQREDLLSYFELENNGLITKSGCNMNQVKPLDRETMDILRYKLNAYDGEGNYVTDTTVTVWVRDINDEPPVVDEKTLRASVQEDVAIGKKFHRIVATDADVGFSYTGGDIEKNELKTTTNDYNKIAYEKVDGTDPDNLISVDKDGNLSVNKELDREKSNGQIKFQVKIRDWPKAIGKRDHFESTHEVVIDVLDANDHAPVIVGGNTHQGSVVESASVGTSVLTFEATDADEGLNSEVTFMIVDGNDGGHFEVESVPRANGASKGTIVVKKPLDYEHGEKNFKLKIRAFNKDATNADAHIYQTEFAVIIDVEDVNEAPVFKNTESYQGNIMEEEPGQAVGSVVAVDEDEGQDFVSYNITNDPLNWFTISKRGEISSKKPLDRENSAVIDGVYKIQISATDKEGATNYVYYDVMIGDKNDNAPKPVGAGWDVSMCHQYDEDQMIGSITTLHVQDIDGPSNQGPFTFKLYPDDKYFKLEFENDTTMGVIPALRAYTVDKVYTQKIIVSDSGTPKQSVTTELTVRACRCDENSVCREAVIAPGGFNYLILIGVLLGLLLLISEYATNLKLVKSC